VSCSVPHEVVALLEASVLLRPHITCILHRDNTLSSLATTADPTQLHPSASISFGSLASTEHDADTSRRKSSLALPSSRFPDSVRVRCHLPPRFLFSYFNLPTSTFITLTSPSPHLAFETADDCQRASITRAAKINTSNPQETFN